MTKKTIAAMTAAAALAVRPPPRRTSPSSPARRPPDPSRRSTCASRTSAYTGTVKVDLRLPDGFYFLSYQKVPGWKARVYKTQLDQPVNLEGFSVDERFTRVVWTARKLKRDRIAPGQFQDLPLSMRIPEGDAGSQLRFRAFQTYERGERVAWTGAPDAVTPAPRLTPAAPTTSGH